MATEDERKAEAAAKAAAREETARMLYEHGWLALPDGDGWSWHWYSRRSGWASMARSAAAGQAREFLEALEDASTSPAMVNQAVMAAAMGACAPEARVWQRRTELGHPAGAWSLVTGETVPGIPFADAVVEVNGTGLLTATPADPSVFDRRGSIPYAWGDGEIGPTPRVEEWLTRLLPAGVDWRWPLRWIGAAMDGWPRHQTMLVLIGDPDSGKSAFAELAGGLAGAIHSVRGNLAALTATHGLAGLPSARVLSIPEFTASARNDRAPLHVLKQLTGCDPVDIEPKGKDAFSIVWGGLVIACTNAPPTFTRGLVDSGAFARRMVTIPIRKAFEGDPDDEFVARLLADEGEALARLCVHEYAAAREAGGAAWRDWPEPVMAESARIVEAGLSEAARFVRERWAKDDAGFVAAGDVRAELDRYNADEHAGEEKQLGIYAVNGVLREFTRRHATSAERGWRLRWLE